MSAYHIVVIAHLFGLAFGLGGASAIDSIFLVASRRGQVTRELVDVVHAAAALIAGAMVLLAVSGAAFFLVGAEATPKFWAKMVVVGVACANGAFAHRRVFPLIDTAVTAGTGRLQLRPWSARMVAASAAVSTVSWSSALILGAWRGLSLGVVPILAAYAALIAVAVAVSAIVAPQVFVFNPHPVRPRRNLRLLPLHVACSVAVAIAGAALAIADRLNGRMELAGSAGSGQSTRFAAPEDASPAGRHSPDDDWGWSGDWGWSAEYGVPSEGLLPQDPFAIEDEPYGIGPYPGPFGIDDEEDQRIRRAG